MGNTITVECNSQTVLQVLEKLVGRFEPKGMRPAMMQIGEALTESTKRRFDSSTAPDGSPWKPRATGTVLARYNKMFYDHHTGRMRDKFLTKKGQLNARGRKQIQHISLDVNKPLVDTGNLKRQIRYQITDGGAGVVIGTNRFADEWEGGAAVHQFGSKDGRIPARPFLGLSSSDERMVLDILNGFIQEFASR